MATVSVADLLRAGRIETIPPDVIAAWSRIDEANAHLVSSAALAKSDPALAYVALYDAARKAVTAHMQAWLAADQPNWGAPGGRVVAEAALAGGANSPDVQAFDRMRQIRNRSEYNQQPITERLLAADLVHAKAIVAAVEGSLPVRP